MTGYRCSRLAGPRLLGLATLCLAGGFLLSGCTDFKRVVGLEQVAPDEFAVESRAPLTMPPDFDLRPPHPGAPRPQEVSTATKAREAIDTAGPGKPGHQETVGLHLSGSIPFGGGADPNAEVAADSLSSKLLGYRDKGGTGAVESRKTTPLKGVY
jgi:Protein of unknown function (DUF3035)